MDLAISAILFVCLAAAIAAYGYRSYVRPAKILDQIGPVGNVGSIVGEQASRTFHLTTVLQWVGEKVPESAADSSVTRRLLVKAGFRSDAALAIYSGARVLSVVGLVVAAFLVLQQTRFPAGFKFLLLGVALFVGYLGPSLVLDELIKIRKERLRFSLPDALDLLVVCVESGLGLDQAITNVSTELALTHPDISRELSLVSVEMRAGADRATALRNLADRSAEEEIRKLVAVLIQTDRFGTSLAQSLRTHAAFLRVRRRHEAEERAGKLGVKLTIPIFFFILPSIIVVAAGPAIFKLVKDVLPALRNPGL